MEKKPRIQIFLENFFLTLFSILKIILLSKSVKIKRNGNSEECVILGNGPSLEGTIKNHRDFLNQKDLVCVNHFPSTPYFEILKPEYYITSAPDLWKDDIEEKFMINSRKMFQNMADKTDWPLRLFIPCESKKYERWQKQLAPNKNISITFYNNTPVEGLKNVSHWLFRKNMGMPRPHNVMIPSIFITLNLNYKKIYLWGTDHSWLSEIFVAEDNTVYINQKHFYDVHNSKPETLDKRGKGSRKLHELLYKFTTAFKGYFHLKAYADELNAEIINNTEGSFIDAFERMKL